MGLQTDRQGVDDDLLRPSLTEEDDAGEFDRPWNPTALCLLVFFIGLPGTGPFLLWNFKRLGLKRHFWAAVALVVGVSCLVIGGRVLLAMFSSSDAWAKTNGSIVTFAARLMFVVAAWPIVLWQKPRWRLAEWMEQPKGNIWVAILGAIGVSVAIFLSLWPLFAVISPAPGFQAR